MFRMILFTQWKWSRLVLMPCVLAASLYARLVLQAYVVIF